MHFSKPGGWTKGRTDEGIESLSGWVVKVGKERKGKEGEGEENKMYKRETEKQGQKK